MKINTFEIELFPFSVSRMKFLENVYQYTSNKHNFASLDSKLSFGKVKRDYPKWRIRSKKISP